MRLSSRAARRAAATVARAKAAATSQSASRAAPAAAGALAADAECRLLLGAAEKQWQREHSRLLLELLLPARRGSGRRHGFLVPNKHGLRDHDFFRRLSP